VKTRVQERLNRPANYTFSGDKQIIKMYDITRAISTTIETNLFETAFDVAFI